MSAKTERFDLMKVFCIVCTDPIEWQRIVRNAETCGHQKPSCKTVLRRMRRELAKTRKCKQCGNPSTPEERKLFRRWRKDMQLQGLLPKPERKPYTRQKRARPLAGPLHAH